jgi:hypothetical protein
MAWHSGLPPSPFGARRLRSMRHSAFRLDPHVRHHPRESRPNGAHSEPWIGDDALRLREGGSSRACQQERTASDRVWSPRAMADRWQASRGYIRLGRRNAATRSRAVVFRRRLWPRLTAEDCELNIQAVTHDPQNPPGLVRRARVPTEGEDLTVIDERAKGWQHTYATGLRHNPAETTDPGECHRQLQVGHRIGACG